MTKNSKIAYFCMEYGLTTELKTYAGGLGILAGDILKTARDYDYPVVGIGLLWRQGYTRQQIDRQGKPVDSYPINDYIYQYVEDTGITVTVKIRKKKVYCKVWELCKPRGIKLYLLDTNLKRNGADKWITGQLYGWFEEERIAQEIVLGIGGVRALRQLGEEVDLFHFNEGHAVLAGTELIKEKLRLGYSFNKAWQLTREEIVFTTHTPVEQGNEEHGLKIMEYMGAFNGLKLDHMVQLGRAPFSMTAAGLKLAGRANGVSQLHATTARRMWDSVSRRAPIKAITNGVHRESWVDPVIRKASTTREIWERHQQLKQKLIDFIEDRNGTVFDPRKLLIGFARRAVAYKRHLLVFKNMDLLRPLLEEQKLQFVISGKAHPLDDQGKKIIRQLIELTEKYPESIVFLKDYDIEIGTYLTRGVDLWLNTPRRPREACGTSGIKAAMNGVLNLSILDGWWDEACQHGENGWQFADGYQGKNQDEYDLKALYSVLLEEVVPAYYKQKSKWKEMMVNSIDSVADRFSAKKMLDDYYEKLY